MRKYKNLLLVLALITGQLVYSQAKLGKIESDILNEVKELEYPYFVTEEDRAKFHWIGVDYPNAIVGYGMNKYKVCYMTLIIPRDIQTILQYKWKYDRDHVKSGPDKWYVDDDVVIVLKDVPKTEQSVFIWMWRDYYETLTNEQLQKFL